jgi:long-chain acyl-CoA synthetase
MLDDDFTEAAGELTPTLKLKRHVIMERYRQEVEALYVGQG